MIKVKKMTRKDILKLRQRAIQYTITYPIDTCQRVGVRPKVLVELCDIALEEINKQNELF